MTARWAARARDDRGSMPMLLLVMLVGLTFGALLIPMIITQDQTTRFDISRTHSLHAAQAGINVALGQVSSAAVNGVGDTKKLPCGPLSGTVGSGSSTYTVSLSYYVADPVLHFGDDAWLTGNKMVCVGGYGTYKRDTVNNADIYVPSFVLLTSSGSDGPGVNGASPGRTITSTYVVKTTNSIVAGGIIRIFPDDSGGDYCMDAGDVRTQGSVVSVRECSPARSAAQSWTYNADRSIQLASSVIDTTVSPDQPQSNGLCLDSATPHKADNPVFLGWCAPQKKDEAGVFRNTEAPWNQQWNSDDNAHLRGSLQNLSDWDAFCINAASPRVSGQAITLQSCAGSVIDPKQAWAPSPSVGSGAATAPDPAPPEFLASSHQLVNFQQFGRCLDVQGQKVSATYMIAYSCKQNPDPTKVTWNQRWAFRSASTATAAGRPDTGQWITYNKGTTNVDNTYCLNSTRTVGTYVTVTKCAGANSAATTWTTNLTLDAAGNELPYSDKYTIVDSTGLCLGLAPTTDLHNTQYFKVITAVCDGSSAQKWNALPNLRAPTLQNTIEVPFRP